MRGRLSIKAAHAPFRRAGLYFGTAGEAITPYVRELDGTRLLALVQDPALTVSIEVADGRSKLLRFDEGDTVDDYEDLVRSFPELSAEEMGFEPADPIASELTAIAEKLKAGGFTSIDALISAHVAQSSQLSSASSEVTRLTGELEERTGQLSSANGELSARQGEIEKLKGENEKLAADHKATREALDKANAAAAKAPAAKTVKPKAAGTAEEKPA